MKRVVLFLLTNLAVMLVLGVAASLLGVNRWMGPQGLQMGTLLAWCAVFGMGGSFISLLLSKPMAKWTTGARVITGHEGQYERWLVQTVEQLAQAAGIRTPEVAYYEGAPNAFATGAFRNSALVAVSSGLVNSMEPDEVRAVLAHEVAHIANGDMQTMGLLQGVMNTFVLLAARVVGSFVDRALSRDENDGPGVGYTMTVVVLDLLFGILASLIVMAFSRHREYRADWGAAELLGSAVPMQRALLRLSGAESDLPKQVAAFGISGGSAIAELFRSHPRIDDRIEALKQFGR